MADLSSPSGTGAAPNRSLALLTHPRMIDHDPGPGHPERPDRLRSILSRMQQSRDDRLKWIDAAPVSTAAIERVHSRAHVARIESVRERHATLDPDTLVSPASVEAAYLAAGAAARAVDIVVDGLCNAAFALVRPPGHHAERERAMGFCLFNNVAVAAAHAIEIRGLERVMIIDWDVHHGNGTQEIFEQRRDVLFFSAHEFPNYPGTGALDEVGTGMGAGFTINAPLPGGCGDREYADLFRRVVAPIADAYRPQLVLVSAGFDAHAADPLASMRVTEAGFAWMTRIVQGIADRHADGRLAFVLEGGYDLAALASSVEACVYALLERDHGPAASMDSRPIEVVNEIRAHHARWWPVLAADAATTKRTG